MENTKIFDSHEFNVISSSENCYKCRFKCEIILDKQKTINLYCRHPRGPGKPEHCIYFKS